ncbi:hypothetical protein [Aeromicrobium sp. 179-A 4D2 NHS]|uniref:hypothetical protein n=1 Tax=Aeromicrobium sp. 179-A 4D2 NHS TaxID=3142375 RepID=UPI0039A01183
MSTRDVNVEKGKQGFQPRAPKPETSKGLPTEPHDAKFGPHADTVKSIWTDYHADELDIDKIDQYYREISKTHVRSKDDDGYDPSSRFAATSEVNEVFAEYLFDRYPNGSTGSKAEKKFLFEHAWERGHSDGIRAVENEYIDMIDFLDGLHKARQTHTP